jgi:hypothetical protein
MLDARLVNLLITAEREFDSGRVLRGVGVRRFVSDPTRIGLVGTTFCSFD